MDHLPAFVGADARVEPRAPTASGPLRSIPATASWSRASPCRTRRRTPRSAGSERDRRWGRRDLRPWPPPPRSASTSARRESSGHAHRSSGGLPGGSDTRHTSCSCLSDAIRRRCPAERRHDESACGHGPMLPPEVRKGRSVHGRRPRIRSGQLATQSPAIPQRNQPRMMLPQAMLRFVSDVSVQVPPVSPDVCSA